MNTKIPSAKCLFAALIISLIFAVSARATESSYQVTGPVLAVTGTSITVQKDNSPWVILKDANTHTAGDIKVGEKVAVKYHMVAETIAIKTIPGK